MYRPQHLEAVVRFANLVLRPLHWFLAAPQIVRLLSERQVCSLSTEPQMSTTLHYTITVCCNRTAQSRLATGVEARELNLKYAWATGELNP